MDLTLQLAIAPMVAAPLIVGGVKALVGYFKGRKEGKAAEEAAKIQSDAAKRMEGIYGGVYQQQMRGMDPYANLGAQAANTLGRLMTPGVPYTQQLQMQDAARFTNPKPQWSTAPGETASSAGSRDRNGQPIVGTAVPRIGGPSNMVRLQAPNGSMRDVPAEQADALIAKGARRV